MRSLRRRRRPRVLSLRRRTTLPPGRESLCLNVPEQRPGPVDDDDDDDVENFPRRVGEHAGRLVRFLRGWFDPDRWSIERDGRLSCRLRREAAVAETVAAAAAIFRRDFLPSWAPTTTDELSNLGKAEGRTRGRNVTVAVGSHAPIYFACTRGRHHAGAATEETARPPRACPIALLS